jgi:hypothetical protein
MMTVISKRIRCFATAPGNDPMDLMKESFYKRKLCDESGFRLPNVHWTMSIAFPSEDLTKVGISFYYAYELFCYPSFLTDTCWDYFSPLISLSMGHTGTKPSDRRNSTYFKIRCRFRRQERPS